MYLAEEITAKTHQFHHSRKKPKSVSNPTHRQGPLFADMLHETDPDQRERAHHVCGSTTIYNTKGAARLFCGRRDCPVCFSRRYRRIAARIRIYTQDTKQKLYWKKIHSWEHQAVVRGIKKDPHGEYICLPVITDQGEEKEYIISNAIKGSPMHTDYPRLETALSVITKTPNGRKISFSSGFRVKKRDGDKLPQFFGRITLAKIVPHALAVGGTIKKVNKSYIRWDVNAEKLTDRLVDNDIVAYQTSMLETIFDKDLSVDTNADGLEKVDGLEAGNFEAIPLNNKGKAVAPPVKLRQLLNNSNGVDLHKEMPVLPQLNNLNARANSPPPV